MKTLKSFLPIIFFTGLLFYHCGTDNPAQNSGGPQGTDTTFQSFVIIYTGATPIDTLHFSDRNLCIGQYNGGSNSTYCLLNDTATQQNISVSFPGSATGTFIFTFGFMTYNGGSYNGSAITGTVSLYESIGGKIKGTYNGNFSDGTTTYQVIASFTVRRTQ